MRQNGHEPTHQPNGDPSQLPECSSEEVWVGTYSARGGSGKTFHTERDCQHLQNLAGVQTAPESSLSDGWSVCSQCQRLSLPDREKGEVWIGANQAVRGVTSFHTDASCHRLQEMGPIRVVSRSQLTGTLSDLEKCGSCGDGYHESRGKTGSQLSSLLKQEHVTPDNYKQAIAEWRAEHTEDE
jgi:hypothetical protein